MLTGDRQVEVARPRHLLGLVVGVSVGEVDALFLVHLEHADPLHVRVAALVVLVDTGVDTLTAANAARDVQGVAELDVLHRALHADLHVFTELRRQLRFEAREDLGDVRLGELGQMLAEEGCVRGIDARARRGSRATRHDTQEVSAGEPLLRATHLVTFGGVGAANGAIGLNLGTCESWQCTHKRYSFSPFQLPVRRP